MSARLGAPAGRSGAHLARFGVLLASALGGTASAQTMAETSGAKMLQIVRINEAPVVDGRLDEAVWSRAALVEDLHQIDPQEYAQPSQRSEIRIYFDDDALYIGARLWDTNAAGITAQVLRQGEALDGEDRFAVIIDPYLDRRNGYRFQVNPNGVRWDALYQDTDTLESNWDGIWLGAATRDAEGWTAEMAIPFKTISFNPSLSQWGINFERAIQRNGETLGWVSRNRQMNPSIAGTADGFEGLQQGVGLDVVPSIALRRSRRFATAVTPRTDTSDAEPSLDIFYKVTPSLNAALTINTDFSATEIDDRQVNLTRFSLFFPEKRDFFLQDADIFEFGRIGGGAFVLPGRGGGGGGGSGGNPAIPNAAAQNARPFFSRKLGLAPDGSVVDIEHGAKLSGRAGRWNIGALAIRQDEFDDVEANDIFVGRIAANVLQESAVGVIMTDGDPLSNDESRLAGADFRFRNSRLRGNRVVESQAWYQETENASLPNENNRAFGFGISAPNTTRWRGTFATRQVEENFYPAVGFIDRVGIRDQALDFGYQRRLVGRRLRSHYSGLDAYRVVDSETGDLETKILALRFTLQNNSRDTFIARAVTQREIIDSDFTIYNAADGSRRVVIPQGDYVFTNYRVGIDSADYRKFAGRTTWTIGDFYDGKQFAANSELIWRPSMKMRFGVGYQISDIELPAGDFVVRVSSLRTELVFSSTLSWVNLVQYDNVSENLGVNSRLHWIPQAGREGFIVLNHNLSDRDKNDSFHSTAADIAVKFSYTWRF